MIYKIESLNNHIIKYTNKLKMSKNIKKEGKFIIEGDHLLKMASPSDICYILALKEQEVDEKIDQYIVNENIMEKISSYSSIPEVIAVCKINNNNKIEGDLVLYLDNLQDPGNIGTILRTALAFDVKTVIASNSIVFYNFKTIQASQGAIFKLNLIQGNIDFLLNLKKDGYRLISSTLKNNSQNLQYVKKGIKSIIVLGNEGNGIRDEVANISDVLVKIPIKSIDSLNVAIAGGILLYYFSTIN